MKSFLRAGDEIKDAGGLTVEAFWSWAYSDVLSNANRSVFAEFLVGAALGCLDTPRIEWDAYDLRYHGWKIEVKVSAYLQSWQQAKPSYVSFDIGTKRGWDATTNTMSEMPERSADCYVFCLYTEMEDRAPACVLDTDRWRFFVLPTSEIDAKLRTKRVSLKTLQSLTPPVAYGDLQQRVDTVLPPLLAP